MSIFNIEEVNQILTDNEIAVSEAGHNIHQHTFRFTPFGVKGYRLKADKYPVSFETLVQVAARIESHDSVFINGNEINPEVVQTQGAELFRVLSTIVPFDTILISDEECNIACTMLEQSVFCVVEMPRNNG